MYLYIKLNFSTNIHITNRIIMIKYILLLLACMGTELILAQEQFVKTLYFDEFDDSAVYENESTKDGGNLTALLFRLPINVLGSAITKTDAHGNLEWIYSFINEVNQQSRIYQILEREEGGYLAFGFEGPPFKTFVILLDQNGKFQWRKDYLAGTDIYFETAIKTKDGGYMITGSVQSTSTSQDHCHLLKLDSNADVEWAKSYKSSGQSDGTSVLELIDGGYMLVGGIDIVGSGREVYVIRTDANGNRIWAKTFGKGTTWSINQIGKDSFVFSIIVAFGNNKFTTNFICIDGQGDKIWAKKPSDDKILGMLDNKLSKEGNSILFSGHIRKKVRDYGLLMSMNKNGEIQWAKSYRLSGADGYSISTAQDGGYFLTGDDYDVLEDRNLITIKTDSLGNVGCLEKDESILLTDYDFVQDTVGYSVPFTVQVMDHINIPILLNPIESTICTTVAANELHNTLNISISPNPVNDELTIQLGDLIIGHTIRLAITDLTGRMILLEEYASYDSTYRVNTSNLAKGLYLLTVKSNNSAETIKFVVNH